MYRLVLYSVVAAHFSLILGSCALASITHLEPLPLLGTPPPPPRGRGGPPHPPLPSPIHCAARQAENSQASLGFRLGPEHRHLLCCCGSAC